MSHFASLHLDGDPEGLARLRAILHGPASPVGEADGSHAGPGRHAEARQGRAAAKGSHAALPAGRANPRFTMR